jgi:hypothetical protein
MILDAYLVLDPGCMIQDAGWNLEFDIWDLDPGWNLGFDIWDLDLISGLGAFLLKLM